MYCKILIVAIAFLQICISVSDVYAHNPVPDSAFISTLTAKEQQWIKENPAVRYTSIPNWMPLANFTDTGQYVGIGNDILQLVEGTAGIKFNAVVADNSLHALQLAVDGKVDIIAGDISDIILNKTFTPVESFLNSGVSIVMKATTLPVKDLNEIQGGKIGLLFDYGYTREVVDQHPDIKFQYVDTVKAGLDSVSHGELNAFIVPRMLGSYEMSINSYQDIKFVGSANTLFTPTFFVSQNTPELFSVFVKALNYIDDALLREIVASWVNPINRHDQLHVLLTQAEKQYLSDISPIKFTGDPDWLPYEAVDGEGNYIGQVADHIALIQRMLGVVFEFIPTNTWSESVALAKSGKVDILSETSSSFLSEQLLFTNSYSKTPIVFAMRDTENYVDNFNQIKDKKIGLVKDYGITSAVIKKYPNQNFYFFDSIQDALVGVSTRKIDAVFVNSSQAIFNIKKLGLRNVRIVGKSHFESNLAFAVQPDKPELVNILNKALAVIIHSKEQQAIYNKWNDAEYNEVVNYSLIYKIVFVSLFVLFFGALWLYKLKKEVDKRKAIAKRLFIAEQSANIANKAKSNFLAVISHELRTPLNGIMGMLELLEKSKLNSEQMTMAHLARRSSESLLNILNDVLDFSKIEANKMSLVIEPANIKEMIEACVNTLAQNAYDKGLFVEMFVSPELNREFQVDAARISQVVNNFLNNAIKFTSKGGVSIYATLLKSTTEVDQLSIAIKDTGIGISETNQKMLFQEFVQVDMESQRKFSGSGLGLSICKRLSQLMKGDIELESKVNFGTKVTYTQPIEYTDEVHKKEKWSDFTFFVLSDDDLVCDILDQYLTYYGAKVNVLTVTPEKTEYLTGIIDKLDADIVFIDKVLLVSLAREKNLSETSAYIKAFISQTKVIQLVNENNLSANSLVSNKALLNTNPLQPSFLELLVDISLNIEDSTNTLSYTPIAKPSRKSIKLLVAEDHPTNRSLISRQLDYLGYQYDVVEDGYEAIIAWKNGSFDGVLTDCHMPNTDGYTLARYIREHNVTEKPIIAMTANALSGEKEKCLQSGMNDLLVKPIQISDLENCLLKWLYKNMDDNCVIVESNDEVSLDKNKFKALSEIFLGDDNVAPMLEAYWYATDNDLTDIKQALKDNNKTAIKSVAHKMIGAASIIKADKIVSTLKTIENKADDLDLTALSDLVTDLEDSVAVFKTSLTPLEKQKPDE